MIDEALCLRAAVAISLVTLAVVCGCGSATTSEGTAASPSGKTVAPSLAETVADSPRLVIPDLECSGERSGTIQPALDPTRPGAASEESAAQDALSYYVDRHGGSVVALGSDVFAMELDGRIVVVAIVSPAPAGGYWSTTLHVCESVAPVENGPPATEAAAGAPSAVSPSSFESIGCREAAPVELVSVAGRVTMDVVFYEEMSATCGLNFDGPGVIDDAWRPAKVLRAPDGEVSIVLGRPGELSVDVRLLTADLRLATLTPVDALTADDAGTYLVALDGEGCFVITADIQFDVGHGRYTALAGSDAAQCVSLATQRHFSTQAGPLGTDF